MKNFIKQLPAVFLGFFMTTFFPKSQDKAWHQMTGVYVAIVMLALNINSWITLGAVIVLGVGYEVYQKVTGKGQPEVMDAVRTILGGLFVLFWYLVNWGIGNY